MAHDSSEPTSVLKKGLALSPAQKLNAKEGTNPGSLGGTTVWVACCYATKDERVN